MSFPTVLSICTLGVADVAASVAFYESLGFRRAHSSMAEIAWFDLGGPWLGVFGAADLATDAGVSAPPRADGPPAGFAGFTLSLNVATPAEVDAALAAAVAAGGSPVKPGTRAEWGGYSGYFADPDGHLWEVAHNPMFPIGPDGRITIP